ncbi:MAG: hypothetical protein PF518_10465 [Spirochaetaceae bacterium]|jgi:predicted LPLAT superfamily acyltransferase|nr:hypothetical protein [Spirochaetaceae bacterium]
MSHWSGTKEKGGTLWQMRLLFILYKKIGFRGMRVFLHPITFFYFIFSPSTRKISLSFLKRVSQVKGSGKNPGNKDVYWHIYSFCYSLIEKVAAWSGDLHSSGLIDKSDDIQKLKEQLTDKRGAVIICSHLGNIEMLRAFANHERGESIPQFGINSVVDFSVTSKFNQLLKEINPESMIHLINASAIDPSTIISLQDKINDGEIVVIAGDRTAKKNRLKSTKINFFGKQAYFPQGAFVLAGLLESPVYYMFALREDDLDFSSSYEFHVYRAKVDFKTSRRERNKKLQEITEEFVRYLEFLCLEHPYQWYNFFDFWDKPQ